MIDKRPEACRSAWDTEDSVYVHCCWSSCESSLSIDPRYEIGGSFMSIDKSPFVEEALGSFKRKNMSYDI